MQQQPRKELIIGPETVAREHGDGETDAGSVDAARAKSEFLAMMSHELRTPLSQVLGFAELLAEESGGELPAQQVEYVQHILSAARHLQGLIDALLDLAQLEAGRARLEVQPLEPGPLLHEVAEAFAAGATASGVALELDLRRPIPPLAADARRLRQIVVKLLDNALKFTPAGGRVRLEADWLEAGREVPRLGEAPPPAAAGHARERARIWISVADNGIGIDPADHERVFSPFEQVDASYCRPQPGTGIGLVVARRVVELHGGRIWVESDGDGTGSRFSLVLPLDGPS
ncbi:MAG: sensor histidine kinase [Thermoanaerobaculia bacterium]